MAEPRINTTVKIVIDPDPPRFTLINGQWVRQRIDGEKVKISPAYRDVE